MFTLKRRAPCNPNSWYSRNRNSKLHLRDADPTAPASRHMMPERRLLMAVVCRALMDAKGMDSGLDDYSNGRFAWNWFHDDSNLPFSFNWVCEHVSGNPDYFKEVVMRCLRKATWKQMHHMEHRLPED